MKIAFIFWWVSLIPPSANIGQSTNVGPNSTDIISGGLHQEAVRYFDTIDECKAAQDTADEQHRGDFIVMSICGGESGRGLYGVLVAPGAK